MGSVFRPHFPANRQLVADHVQHLNYSPWAAEWRADCLLMQSVWHTSHRDGSPPFASSYTYAQRLAVLGLQPSRFAIAVHGIPCAFQR